MIPQKGFELCDLARGQQPAGGTGTKDIGDIAPDSRGRAKGECAPPHVGTRSGTEGTPSPRKEGDTNYCKAEGQMDRLRLIFLPRGTWRM